MVALSGMYPEAYKMDVDTKVIDSSGDRLLTTKTAMYVDPKFVDTSKFGSQEAEEILYTTLTGKKVKVPLHEIPYPPRSIFFIDENNDPHQRKAEYPGHCMWCLGEWHPDGIKKCIYLGWCRSCKGYLRDMENGGKKHSCGSGVESAPSFSSQSSFKKASNQTASVKQDNSAAFTAHKKAEEAKKAALKRKMSEKLDARREAAAAKKAKSG